MNTGNGLRLAQIVALTAYGIYELFEVQVDSVAWDA